MKTILTAVLSLLIAQSAWADKCGQALTGEFTDAQANRLCDVIGTLHVSGSGSNYEAVAGAGTVTGDAAALSASKYIHQITGANGTVGWKFSAVTVKQLNQVHLLLNTTAGVAKIYPPTGGTINGGSADAAFSALTGIKPIVCAYTAATTLICS